MERNIPDAVVRLVYGPCGFNEAATEIIDYREPFVLLRHAAREDDVYAVVNTATRLTVVRYADAVQARHALDEFAGDVYRWRPPEEM